MVRKILVVSALSLVVIVSPLSIEAKTLFHATKKAAAKRIMAKGFSVKKLNPKARFGKGIYLSESKKLALKEKPSAKAVVRFKDTKLLRSNTVYTKRFTTQKLKKFSGDKDLRGNIHHGVIGGDLAKKMGRSAAKQGKVISYPSAKGKGLNTFIPQKVYAKNPDIIKPKSVGPLGK